MPGRCRWHHPRVDTARARRRAAVASWLVTMGMSVAALLILFATRDTPVPTSWGFRGASEAFGIVCGTVGAIVAIRRPENLNGWLFCAIGFLFALAALINEYLIAGVLVVPGGLPLTTPLGWLLAWLWVPPLAIAVIFLPLYFPDGRLASPAWRRVVVFSVVAVVAVRGGHRRPAGSDPAGDLPGQPARTGDGHGVLRRLRPRARRGPARESPSSSPSRHWSSGSDGRPMRPDSSSSGSRLPS